MPNAPAERSPRPAEPGGGSPYGGSTLPAGIRSRMVAGINGLAMHILEAGFEAGDRPCLLLLHGFPELAYSWRKVMPVLAAAGYYVVAPDQRGYGRTTGWDGAYDGDLYSFGRLNLVQDALALVMALGYRSVAAVVGHDFGAPNAAYAALVRPDVFRSVVLMSSPFAGPPALPFGTGKGAAPIRATVEANIHGDLARLNRPRKYYHEYYRSRAANADMQNAPQGIAAFLRAYYHFKSADYEQNKPFRLASLSAAELAKMPTYYVMDLGIGMAETVAPQMPSAAQIAACKWLTDAELKVFAEEFARTGFQGGLNWYRTLVGKYMTELRLFCGRTIDVPACYIAGAADWNIFQSPGAFEKMQAGVCTQWRGAFIVEGAGHWVQQEQPDEVTRLLLQFLNEVR